jgi:putative transposase
LLPAGLSSILEYVKLVANLKLRPTAEQAAALRETLERCNAACDWLSATGFAAGVTRHYDLHKLGYVEVRARFGLTAQAAVRCVAKVADAYKAGAKDTRRTFGRHAAQPYDDRILRFLPGRDEVSIWTLAGRLRIPFACGERQRRLLAHRKGEVDLMLVRGKFYLAAVCDIPDPDEIETLDVLGIDLGIVNLAVDSNGNSHSGADIERVRRRHHARRRALQKVGTRSAKRALRCASGRQRRFQRHTNHVLSKAIVAAAERDRAAIALEGLQGIRDRVQAPRRQRARLHNWGFHELRALIAYKAKLRGVPVVLVEPRNTSRECACCGFTDKRNRPNRDTFKCVGCGSLAAADHNAARVIRRRGMRARGFVVMAPQGSAVSAVRPEESRLL